MLQLASVEHLGYPDGEIENDAALRARLIEIVRRRRPDALVAPDPTAVFFGDSYVNHRDHRQLGWAVLDSLVPAASPLYVPEAGPAHQVGLVLLSGTLDADAWVDIDACSTTRSPRWRATRAASAATPTLVAELLEHRAAEEGRRAGVDHAEAFRRLRFPALGEASVARRGGRVLHSPIGAEGQDRHDAHAHRADHGAQEAGRAGQGRAAVRALEVDEAVADQPAAQAADEDRHEGQHAGAGGRQRGGGVVGGLGRDRPCIAPAYGGPRGWGEARHARVA